MPSQHARTVAIRIEGTASISAFAFYTGSSGLRYARPSSQRLPRRQNALKRRAVSRPLYDDIICTRSRQSMRPPVAKTILNIATFLRLFTVLSATTPCQRNTAAAAALTWARSSTLYRKQIWAVVRGISVRPSGHWQLPLCRPHAPLNEALFMALLFSMIRLPDPRFATRINGRSSRDWRVARLVLRFRGNVRWRRTNDRLYVHLARALNREVYSRLASIPSGRVQPSLSSGSHHVRGARRV